MKPACAILVLLIFAGKAASAAADAQSEFRPGEVWLDTDGKPIQAHSAGILFRAALLPGSAYALVTVTAGSGIRFDYRSTYAATSVSGGTAAGTAPVWLKLVRAGDLFSAFFGPDGVHWTSVGSPVTITNTTWPVPGSLIIKSGWVLSLSDTSGYVANGVYYGL